jgi:molybdenum cofactor cytidylyltransferase
MAGALEVDFPERCDAGAVEVNVTGVILAAGLSRRMGFPKSLLRWGDETYLDRIVRMFDAVCGDVIVVMRPGGVLPIHGRARVVLNEDADRGQLSSLQTGLAACEGAVLFSPVDYAHVEEATVRAVVGARSDAYDVMQPIVGEAHGHPVLIERVVADALLAAPADGRARDVVRRFRRGYVAVDDVRSTMDADDPAAAMAVRETLR